MGIFEDMVTEQFCEAVITGIISSVILSLFIICLQSFRYWYKLKRHFHNVKFNTYWKRYPDEVVQKINCKVRRNIISFEGERVLDKISFKGEIIVNPVNLKTANGFHAHDDIEGFGFLNVIIISKNEFLVEAPYIAVKENSDKHKVGSLRQQAFIWRKE